MEADRVDRMVFTYPAFCRLCKEYAVRLRAMRCGPFPPVYYALAASRLDGEPVMLLWRDEARSEWIGFAPDEADEDVRELLGLDV